MFFYVNHLTPSIKHQVCDYSIIHVKSRYYYHYNLHWPTLCIFYILFCFSFFFLGVFLVVLVWYGHVMGGDINSQIREVIEDEITGKRKKGRPRKSWEDCVKKDLEWYGLKREDAYYRNKWRERISKNC